MAEKYRVLFTLTRAFDPNQGGVQMSTWKMASWFASRGHAVAVFSSAVDGHKPQSFAEVFCGIDSSSGFSRGSETALASALQDFSPQIVINQMPYEWPLGDVLKSNKNYALIGCLRNTLFSVRQNIDDYRQKVLPRWLHRVSNNDAGNIILNLIHRQRHRRELEKILRIYDRFVMFGPPNLDELTYFVGNFDRTKVSLIPNSIPHVLRSVPPKEKRLLWLGRLENSQKRVDLIVPLWKVLSNALSDWHLDIVGDGPARSKLEEAIAKSRLQRVAVHGRQVPNLYYQRSPIYIMTSAWEGFPNTVVEAQSFGAVPVLFDSFPIAKWMISDGEDGFLVKPLDIEAMARTVIDLASRTDLSIHMSSALENAQRFHIDRVGKMWEALFESLVREDGGRALSA